MTPSLHRSMALAALAAGMLGGCAAGPQPRSQLEQPDSPPAVPQSGFAEEQAGPVRPAAALALPSRPPEARPQALDLPELQRLALEYSPSLKQAAADVAAARGAAVQAGLYPNPTVGYQGDQIGSGHTAGQQGGFVAQTFVTQG